MTSCPSPKEEEAIVVTILEGWHDKSLEEKGGEERIDRWYNRSFSVQGSNAVLTRDHARPPYPQVTTIVTPILL